METVLSGLPDEAMALSPSESMGPLANPFDPSQGFADDDAEKPYDPWEDDQGEASTRRTPRRSFSTSRPCVPGPPSRRSRPEPAAEPAKG